MKLESNNAAYSHNSTDYNHPLGGQGLQSWHVAHPEPTFECTPINSYSTNAPFQGAFDLQSLQQVPPFDACCSTTKADEASRHAVQGHVGTAEAVGLTTRPALSDVPRTLPLLLPNRAHRVGRGSVEHQPAHIKKPDLFAGLDGQQSTPTVSDSMLMALPDVEPKPQSPRSESDLYTARWTVGEGKDRRGWCGYCSTYWKLKDSAYWYHLHYCHGVLSGGDRMPEPRAMREGRGAGSWEVQCGTCERWVALASGDKGRTGYFRHVYKCLTPLKREGSRLKNNGSRKSAATS